MKHSTGICAICGGDQGIHQYETMLCPRFGREEIREGKRQEWDTTVFEDKGEKQLNDIAPEMLQALKNTDIALTIIIRELPRYSTNQAESEIFQQAKATQITNRGIIKRAEQK